MPKNTTSNLPAGTRFGRLAIISQHHQDNKWRRYYQCKCDCGATPIVHGSAMVSGNTQSCGCLSAEKARQRGLPMGEAAMRQVIAGYRQKAKKSGRKFAISKEAAIQLLTSDCFYCGAVPANVKKSPHQTGDFKYNGIDRIDSRLGYVVGNVVPCCRICNIAKNTMNQEAFISWIKRAAKHLEK